MQIPKECRILVLGGGVVGASVAYHLAHFGERDIVLLEQGAIGGGTTWHAAGMIGRLRTSNSLTKINKYSAELYADLERLTGHSVGWKQVGSIIVGKSQERMVQLRRTAAMAELLGVEARIIKPEAAQEKFPMMRVDDLEGAAWLPHDGKVIPREVATALTKGARSMGVTVMEGVRVESIIHKGGSACGVVTQAGTITAAKVVICGGMWSRQVALGAGVSLPLYPVEHHYVVSQPISGVWDELPLGRDPDLCIYFRGEGNSIMLGAFQKYTKPWLNYPVPNDFSFKLLDPDWAKYEEPLMAGKWRLPCLESSGWERFVNGPESFTPDNNFLMGETPELRNLYVATGFNSVGIASAGGAGKYLAEWIVEGRPTIDLWSVDIRRFGPVVNNLPFLRERVTEVLGLHYQMAWPNREFETGRKLRVSPLHARLESHGACFGVKAGWERPNWFAVGCEEPVTKYSFDKQNWFESQAREHQATREACSIFDQSSFGKIMVRGHDSLSFLQRLCGNDLDVAVGRIVYTGLFNNFGGFESDVTVCRMGANEFLVVTGTAQIVKDLDWFKRQKRAEERVEWEDVTEAKAVLGVMGPRSRDLLSCVTDANLSNEAFPFGTARWVDIGFARVWAMRTTYVGELGWELYCNGSQSLQLFDSFHQIGKRFGLVNAGHYTIQSLRMEKANRAWGTDLSVEDTPLEAGLSFAVAWNKPVAFVGREALVRRRQEGWLNQLLTFVLEDSKPVIWGGEPILRNGKPVGYTTSGSYGHTLRRAVGMGYVRHESPVTRATIPSGVYEIGVAGQFYVATPYLKAPVDPVRAKIFQ